ncbi:hypothetical protein LG3211_3450 [Lysobacter gummosus]|nr:hypothetical protein LG3211_3450 [Lysobacter gummosus]
MPSFWTIINARLIFEEAYRAVYLHWQAAICNRGLSLPDPELLGIPQLETI